MEGGEMVFIGSRTIFASDCTRCGEGRQMKPQPPMLQQWGVSFEGEAVPSSLIGAVVADRLLKRNPGATVLYNLICSDTVRETIESAGGTAVRTRVGHSFIKQTMAETGAVFGGEHSAHYYFARNFNADSGLIASLLVMAEIGRSGMPLSELRIPFERYSSSGEINTQVDDTDAVIERLSDAYAEFAQSDLDGLTVDCGDWWFNLRPSNTEPLLRLNLEAPDRDACDDRVAELLALITT